MNKGKSTIKKLFFISVLMFGFSFLLVPIYSIVCDLTGLNGNTSNLKLKTEVNNNINTSLDSSTVKIQFVSNSGEGTNVNFKADEFQINVTKGKIHSTYYYFENISENIVVGQAVPSVSPNIASKYLKKIECFCFEQQKIMPGEVLKKIECFCFEQQKIMPGEVLKLPVYFSIDPNIPNDIKTLTLSYTFYKIDNVANKKKINKIN